MWKGEPVVPDKAELKERELLQMERQEAWPWSEATKPGGCAERISHYWRTASWNQNFVWDCLDLFCHKCNIFFKKVKKIACDSAWSVSWHTEALSVLVTLTLPVDQWKLQQKWLPKSKNHCSAPGLVLSPTLGRRLASSIRGGEGRERRERGRGRGEISATVSLNWCFVPSYLCETLLWKFSDSIIQF